MRPGRSVILVCDQKATIDEKLNQRRNVILQLLPIDAVYIQQLIDDLAEPTSGGNSLESCCGHVVKPMIIAPLQIQNDNFVGETSPVNVLRYTQEQGG